MAADRSPIASKDIDAGARLEHEPFVTIRVDLLGQQFRLENGPYIVADNPTLPPRWGHNSNNPVFTCGQLLFMPCKDRFIGTYARCDSGLAGTTASKKECRFKALATFKAICGSTRTFLNDFPVAGKQRQPVKASKCCKPSLPTLKNFTGNGPKRFGSRIAWMILTGLFLDVRLEVYGTFLNFS